MIDRQQVSDLAASTTMTPREAETFLLWLATWQRRDSLTDAQAEECKRAAIEAAYKGGVYSPLDMLLAMYSITGKWR